MSNGNHEASREVRHFEPIPEARALRASELYPTTGHALWQLLQHLRAAVNLSANPRPHDMLSTSFLVSGDRGFGKTTVLLTAAAAIENAEKEAMQYSEICRDDPSAASTLEELRWRIAWLETLDLEPVPKHANLLAALLVRIRDALENATRRDDLDRAGRGAGRGDEEREASESVLGAHIEKTWEELDRLVQEATFMWEETAQGNDPRRERAGQQIKAAEIFASFQRRFTTAVDRVARALSTITFRRDPVLVLPVDNVDRSIEHIYSIVKLCRLASSPRLWFVLAAGRPDFQLFLERSFQQEMASGRLTAEDRDDDLSIARRQASTTMRRALPRAHQIQIEPVDPWTAWTSTKDEHDRKDQRETNDVDYSLKGLLAGIRLPRSGASGESPPSLIQLFDMYGRVEHDRVLEHYWEACPQHRPPQAPHQPPSNVLLTHAARMALLNLAPRALRDLKRSIGTPCKASRVECDEAVQILADQLRSAVDESILPFWASSQLHTRILREDMHGDLVLDLRGSPIGQLKQTHLSHVVPFDRDWRPSGSPRPRAVQFSDVHLRKFDDIVLELRNPENPGQRVPLPADVAGWFMLLHDLLMFFPTPRVISGGVSSRDPALSPELIVTRHELSLDREQVWLEFGWTLPQWDTFLDFSIFTVQWRAFLQYVEKASQAREHAIPELLRFVRAAWVENVCSVGGEDHGNWRWDLLAEHQANVGDYEAQVGKQVWDLRAACKWTEQRMGTEEHTGELLPYERQRRLSRTGEWIRRSLPVLLCNEHSVGHDQKVVDPAELRQPDVLLHRAQLVREVAMRSPAYQSLQDRGGKGSRRWLGSVSEVWLGPPERRHLEAERRRDGVAPPVERRRDGTAPLVERRRMGEDRRCAVASTAGSPRGTH